MELEKTALMKSEQKRSAKQSVDSKAAVSSPNADEPRNHPRLFRRVDLSCVGHRANGRQRWTRLPIKNPQSMTQSLSSAHAADLTPTAPYTPFQHNICPLALDKVHPCAMWSACCRARLQCPRPFPTPTTAIPLFDRDFA